MFMRVRRTVPQFTFGLSERFVNLISSVSTGFFGFSPVLSGFWFISGQNCQQNGYFSHRKAALAFLMSSQRESGCAPHSPDKINAIFLPLSNPDHQQKGLAIEVPTSRPH
jgi:hypothetical protein